VTKRRGKKPAPKKRPVKRRSKPKPRERDFKAEYAARLKRAMAKGKTRQQARGHKPREHIARREREIKEHGASFSQIKSIKSFLARFNPLGFKGVPTEEDLVDFIREEGYGAFQEYRRVWDKARRQYLKELANKTYESRGLPYLMHLTGEAGAPDEKWLYYH